MTGLEFQYFVIGMFVGAVITGAVIALIVLFGD